MSHYDPANVTFHPVKVTVVLFFVSVYNGLGTLKHLNLINNETHCGSSLYLTKSVDLRVSAPISITASTLLRNNKILYVIHYS